jgi:sugar/nucleoside kinase (ribokinase family)
MKKILGIGNALVDVMTILDDDSALEKFSLPKGSMQLVDKSRSELIKSGTAAFKKSLASGGSAANTIYGLAMLGAGAGYIGSIGKDELGDFFENDMKSAGITTFLSRRDSPTGTALALITPDSERTFATHLGAAVELDAKDLDPASFHGYDVLYLEGYQIYNRPLVEEACRIARKEKMKIALDLASYNVVESNLKDFREIIGKYVDIIFANEEEAKAYTGQAVAEALDTLSAVCEVAVIKEGAAGSRIKKGAEIIRIGAAEVSVIDTTGAGDIYAAGFLFGYLNDRGLGTCGKYGSLLAGRVIEILGARIDQSAWKELNSLISEIK